MTDLYVGLDLGTTGIKVGLFDDSGAEVAAASREVRLDTPAPGFAEFDAARYADLAFEAVREVLAAPKADAKTVRAIGFSSQAQTFVLLGADDRPLRPAVSWLDVRAEAEARELSELAGREVNAISSCPKILWLRRNEPETLKCTKHVLVIPDHLIYLLTGRAASDPITAGSTGAYDSGARRWSGDVLKACGLNEKMMPEVLSPGEEAGTLTPQAAEKLGLGEDVLVAVGTNDQSAGALGAGNVTPGCASLALGTALALVVTSRRSEGAPPGEGEALALHPAAGEGRELYVLLGYAKTAGVVLRWFRDNFAPGVSYDELFREAASVPAGAAGVGCLPHFSGTATPDFNPAARGAFSGLSLAHGRAHLARALAESLCFTVRENIELIGRVEKVTELRAIGGGARSDVWLQMIADVSGVCVERPRVREAACLGAAEMAMVAAGRFATVAEAAAALYSAEKRFEPDASLRAAYDEAYARYRTLYQSLYGKVGGDG